ncbi:MAG TPA: hypothetical protein VE964_00360 [Myxococcales bacterium]|nr:hypothetical protein [Myxococcales bacterium]
MNVSRIALATLGGFVVYFAVGGVMFVALPAMRNEFARYPAVYRSGDSIKSVMPVGMTFMLIAIFALAVLYAMSHRGGSGVAEGARFGALVGVFVIGSFVVHNYVNLNIGLRLTVAQAAAYFLEWLAVGIVIGLIYRPAT